jgi:hypothetical protein
MIKIESILLKTSKECNGVSIWLNSDGELNIGLTVFSLVGKLFRIIKTSKYNNISEAKDQIAVGSPLVLSIDGYGIIHKLVDSKDGDETITKILPNAKLSDLYIQKIDQGEAGKVIFSVSRKEKINEIIDSFNELGLYPYDIILGPFGILSLPSLIPPEDEIIIPNYQFRIRDKIVISLKREEQNNVPRIIHLAESEVLSEYLVALGNCLEFIQSNDAISSNITFLEWQRKEFLSKKTIRIAGLSILIIIFLSLLINFSLYTKYRLENQMLDLKIRAGKILIQEDDSLTKIITGKKIMADANGNGIVKFFAYYSDRIAYVIPAYVTLDRLIICPAEKSLKNGNIHIFKKNVISISGRLSTAGYLDQVIKGITSCRWIKEVKILNYSDQGIDPPSFELEIETE